MRHTSVLHKTVLDILAPKAGETVLDVTLGLGGHAKSFLEFIGDEGKLIALDADSDNLRDAKQSFGSSNNVEFHHTNFMRLPELRLPTVDILFADLGLSSPHLDEPERGFSFRSDGPLDMRFDRTRGMTAADLLASVTEDDLVRILKDFGEVKQSRKLAKEIGSAKPKTTSDLRTCVETVCGFRAKSVLPQVFQALRMEVNNELAALEVLLTEGPLLLKEGGRMGVISFHSLEDRMVKQAFRSLTTSQKDDYTGAVSIPAAFELMTKKPVRPSEEEIALNPRARSALFRVIRRVSL